MNADKRKQAIKKKGYTLKQIADALGKSLSTVSNVVSGRYHSEAIANALAKIVDQPVEKFFADCKSYTTPSNSVVVRGLAREQKVDELRQLFSEAS
ncbi:helix-turn-helix transcriptional regulator [Pseudoalteromonas sp. MMG012]|uniref:helix-turn-helix transcriptional regulator n=1 Tax=Pseudoalteromonas sp. MMG012 TaxID=2822686 RepID=UPI001B3A5BA5|nr:helix-turn-helix transcriptional regulator [Pseudoalteromonas sp. MMG012]MBQ4852950.1 helix-turn-helix transcriptional regulator [Pseudoalteromonas sp. MMG012]